MAFLQSSETINIFFSLSPVSQDRNLFEKLRRHLSALKRLGLINLWYDSEIDPGKKIGESIRSYLSQADIFVLLLSSDFFDSDRCVEVEMAYALKQYAAQAAPVIPVLLRPVEFSGFPLDQYQPLPVNGKPISDWSNLDMALTEVVKGIRQVVEKLARRWTGAPRPAKPPQFPLFLLPHRRNPFFTDREEHLAALHQFFTSEQTPQTRIQALHGMGGMGKTLLAIEYACRFSHEYQAVFWLNASSPELLSAGMLSLADQLGIPAYDDLNERQLLAAIKQWLQLHDRWLVVLDDLEDFRVLDQFIPLYSPGHVLVTTQSQATGQFATPVPVDQLTIEEGAILLLRRAKPRQKQQPDHTALEADILEARKIAQEFAGYPLALDQAGAYIEESRCKLASYLDLYHKQKAALLSRRGRLASDHPDPVTTTLALTFQKIAQIDPLALELLRLLAFLHPDGFPDEMIINGASSLDGPLRKLALDPLALDDALTTLQRFSLVHRRADSTTLNLHHILQVVVKKDLTKQQQQQFARQVVRLVNASFPAVLFTTWQVCQRYMPQAQHCATLMRDLKLTLREGAQLLERLGFYCFQRGCYVEAETYLQQALSVYQRQQRADKSGMAQTLNSLGLLYHQQARYKEAEMQHQHALELRTQTLGPDDPKTVESLHNLAMIHGDLGRYQQAEHLFLRVLAVEERAKGPDHPDVADTLNELGLTCMQQGHFAEAEAAYRRALAIYTHARDANHPDLTYPLDGLGTLAEQRGDYQQAESLYQQAFAICKHAFGEMHPEIAHSMNKLAGIAASQGDYQKAEALYRQALTIGEQTSGSEHPDVALILNDQALLATRQQQYQSAEQMYQRALNIYELALGPEHPTVASVLNNLGQLFRAMGDRERAEKLLRHALAIREKVLDAAHPAIAQSQANLADLLADSGKDSDSAR
jgi:tetratricopeptide (TPR) repeat protein